MNSEICKYFYFHVGADVNMPEKQHMLPLHLAARLGKIPIMRLLVTNTDNTTGLNCLDKYKRTPLHIAAWYNTVEAITFLADK